MGWDGAGAGDGDGDGELKNILNLTWRLSGGTRVQSSLSLWLFFLHKC